MMTRHEPTWDLFTATGVAILAENLTGWQQSCYLLIGREKAPLAQTTRDCLIFRKHFDPSRDQNHETAPLTDATP